MTNDETAARLEGLLERATKGDLSTAAHVDKEEWVECPLCSGSGETTADNYCNFDGAALGVQFYGIGREFVNHQELWSASLNALPALLSERRALKDECERLRAIIAEAVPIIDQIKADVLRPPSRDSQDRRVERAAMWLVKGAQFTANGGEHD